MPKRDENENAITLTGDQMRSYVKMGANIPFDEMESRDDADICRLLGRFFSKNIRLSGLAHKITGITIWSDGKGKVERAKVTIDMRGRHYHLTTNEDGVIPLPRRRKARRW